MAAPTAQVDHKRLRNVSSDDHHAHQLTEIKLGAPQAIAEDTPTVILWDTVVRDDGGWFSAGSPGRITVPSFGYYLCITQVRYEQNATGRRQVRLNRVGVEMAQARQNPSSAVYSLVDLSKVIRLDAGQYVEIEAYQTSTPPVTLNVEDPNSWFQVARLG